MPHNLHSLPTRRSSDLITPKTKIIFIANPNNPTGFLIEQEKIDNFLARVPDEVITVLDEAYFEFLDDPPNTLRHVSNGQNVDRKSTRLNSSHANISYAV